MDNGLLAVIISVGAALIATIVVSANANRLNAQFRARQDKKKGENKR